MNYHEQVNCKLPGIVDAVVVKRISNPDLSSIKSLGGFLAVGDADRKHFVCFAQVQPPPGVEVVACVSTRTLTPGAGPIPIDGIICNACRMKCGLRGFSLECQVVSCTKGTISYISTESFH